MSSIRVLTQNFRKSTITETKASREWDRRRPYMREHLKRVQPAVIGAQECTVEQCDDLMNDFLNYTYAGGVRYGNVPIIWDTRKLYAEEHTLLERKYPSGARERYMTLIRLEATDLEWGAWFGSIHLAGGTGDEEPNAPQLRQQQITAMIGDIQNWISIHPHPEDGKPNLIVCGDLNDALGDHAGVRKIAYDLAGWKPLRTRLPLDKIAGNSLRTFQGWRPTSTLAHDGKWLDDIMTSGVGLEDAALRRTCTDVLQIHASDHNGVSADIIT